jgi:3-dehydroquinate dehydratase-2
MRRVIFVLNGPNLNMLGVREREYYGSGTLDDLRAACEAKARSMDFTIDFRQSNYEGMSSKLATKHAAKLPASSSIRPR